MTEFGQRLQGGSLLTAEIVYYRPDHSSLLQSFSWQTIDAAPRFPRLAAFLERWRKEAKAMIYSIQIAHSDWVGPADIRSVNGVLRFN